MGLYISTSRRMRLMELTDGTWAGSQSRWPIRASRISEANREGRSLFKRSTLRTTDGVAICLLLQFGIIMK